MSETSSETPNLNELVKSLDLNQIQQVKQVLGIQEMMVIEKGLQSTDPSEYIAAAKKANDIQQREQSNIKSFLLDPYDEGNSGSGYREKQANVSHIMLRRMARVPVIRAILKTRADQVAAFAKPQPDKYSPGFIIRKKKSILSDKEEKSDPKIVKELTDFILNCGTNQNAWHGDTFGTFTRKVILDSLTFDALTFEVIRNRKGLPTEFLAVDASTIRVASTWDDAKVKEQKIHTTSGPIQGYYPSYVQVYQGQIQTEYYPWELCYGVRNPTTDMMNVCYGQSELEDLIYVVTAILWADQYNMNFFKVGSAPKGILKLASNLSPAQVASFRQSWKTMVAGVDNAGKTPILESDKADFINLQQSSKDMEYSRFQEYLLKICCALFGIDPAEVGFNVGGGADVRTNFESNNDAKLTHSKDKGLRPLLSMYEEQINKFLINPYNSEYEFVFVGLNAESEAEELVNDVTKLNNFMTLNEIREKRGLKPVENGDYVGSGSYFQQQQLIMQQQMQDQQAMMMQQGGGEEMPQ